ncbi:MAG: biotin--[acetyl-CoA-carboxylase] ligase [Oscillospiraceae bacterium]
MSRADFSLRTAILQALETRRGETISGAQLAKETGVTRAAIWKAISQLRAEGAAIDAATNRGYSLRAESGLLNAQGITALLDEAARALFSVKTEPCVTSTNTLLKAAAQAGALQGTVLCAGEQTQGRGRMGRDFYSPPDSGVYLSVILRPAMRAQDALFITTAAAVAVCRAIERLGGSPGDARIKWVNDVFVGRKKVCGILTEAALDFESGGLEYAVLGIGTNLLAPAASFPDDLRKIAGGIFTGDIANLRNRFAAAVLNELAVLISRADYNAPAYLAEYRARSFLLGTQVDVLSAAGERAALAVDIDAGARLVVRYPDGTEEALSSGEVRVRPAAEAKIE